ncbi:flagellar hook protein FlgE [Polaromonas sp. CG_23.6]|uniref:flagellar hook protein FlgE n=1 Tax=Polaromonas sp. CG_23.6 TaxID=2760709 RepID=UPI0024731C99|nr:flagellar hook protein FlgE [Polaromonas sp. CG_23.6]MDH6184113.1 flagellar hook protein FlgE [Polaromonas sp. CG_23.6]
MSFSQGLSGLNASASNLDVIGNNIANAGTMGFKSGSVQFSDVFTGSQIGLGAKVASVSQNFNAGAVQTSARSLDVAIVEGDGFFRMTSPGGEIAYSRNGQFNKDRDGFVVNAAGLQLTGHQVDAAGAMGVGLEALRLPSTAMLPKATGDIAAQFNLDARGAIPTVAFDANNAATYNYSNSVKVYDSLGNPHELATFFVKTNPIAPSTSSPWALFATADGVAVKGPAATLAASTAAATAASGAASAAATAANDKAAVSAAAAALPAATTAEKETAANDAKDAATARTTAAYALAALETVGIKMGQLTFDTSGTLLSPADGKMALEGINFANGSAPMTLAFAVTGTTQYGSASDVKQLDQDGYASGTLAGFSIGKDGTVTGKYSNEQVKTLGQIVLSSFVNPAGLQSKGDNVWTETAASGQALTGNPGAGTKLGALASGSLEASNVDLTSELVNLIIAQRTYQANAQTVKTQDQVVQTLMNIR